MPIVSIIIQNDILIVICIFQKNDSVENFALSFCLLHE